MTAIDKFHRQIGGSLQMLEYFLVIQATFPHVMVQLTPDQTKNIAPQVREWIHFCRKVYKMPHLGSSPPDPMPVDPDCPAYLLSDEIRARLGRNHAFFDFVNAPFTHPIGTEISVTCITTSWNAYDTFVKENINAIRTAQAEHCHVDHLLSAEKQLKDGDQLSSDRKLELLRIGVTTEDLEQTINAHAGSVHFNAERAETILRAGKEIRRSFTHRYGEPTERLDRIIKENTPAELGLRRVDGELEVMLFAARDILNVILLKALVIGAKSRALYGVS